MATIEQRIAALEANHKITLQSSSAKPKPDYSKLTDGELRVLRDLYQKIESTPKINGKPDLSVLTNDELDALMVLTEKIESAS